MLSRPILVISGPSGVGKGSIIQHILNNFPTKVSLSVSQTSREPRKGEINGIHYKFIGKDMSKHLSCIELEKQFLEYTSVHGNFYGTSYDEISRIHKERKLCILDIDSHGVKQIKSSKHFQNCDNVSYVIKYLFIAPPSMSELERRLRGRATENENQIITRLKNAQIELNYGNKDNYDKIIVNNNLDLALKETVDCIDGWFPFLSLGNKV